MSVNELNKNRLRAFIVGLGVVALSLSLSGVTAGLFKSIAESLTIYPVLSQMFGTYIGMAIPPLAYIYYRSVGLEYFDLKIPDRTTLKFIVASVVGVFGLVLFFYTSTQLVGGPTSSQLVTELLLENPHLVVFFIIFVFLVNAPVEELLFRNVMQKRFSESMGSWKAIVLTSLIFLVLHVPAYYGSEPIFPNAVPHLATLFLSSLLFGYVYEESNEWIVATFAHGFYNALQIFIFYITVVIV